VLYLNSELYLIGKKMSLTVFALILYYLSWLSKKHEKSETKYKSCVDIFIQTI